MPSRYTISQLKTKGEGYTIVDTDLAVVTTGTATFDLSSVRISVKEFGDYITAGYAQQNVFSVHGSISAGQGLSANCLGARTINIDNIPSSSSGLQSGDIFTQTVAQIHGSGSSTTKVLCVK